MSQVLESASRSPAGSLALEDGHLQAARFAFLQALMEEGYFVLSDAVALFKSLTGKTQDEEIYQFLSEIQRPLSVMGFRLKQLRHPARPNEGYIGFVNLWSDGPSRLVNPFKRKDGRSSVAHTNYFKLLVQGIATTAPPTSDVVGYMAARDAMRLEIRDPSARSQGPVRPGSSLHLGGEERMHVITQALNQGWLVSALMGYSLGPRSLLELPDYLLRELGDCLPDQTRQMLETCNA